MNKVEGENMAPKKLKAPFSIEDEEALIEFLAAGGPKPSLSWKDFAVQVSVSEQLETVVEVCISTQSDELKRGKCTRTAIVTASSIASNYGVRNSLRMESATPSLITKESCRGQKPGHVAAESISTRQIGKS
jgi:hypothetical protein